VQTGGTVLAQNGFISVGDNASCTWTLTGPSTVADFAFGVDSSQGGRFGVLTGSGTINVLNGATLRGRLFEAGRFSWDTVDVSVNVQGPGSRIDANQLTLPRHFFGAATLTVSDGGQVNIARLAAGTNGAGLIVMGNGTDGVDPGARSVLQVSGAGSQVRCDELRCGSNLGAGTVSISSAAAMIVSGDAKFGHLEKGVGGASTLLVSGAGSRFEVQRTTVMGDSLSSDTIFIRVSNGGLMQSGSLDMALRARSDATLTVDGAESTLRVGEGVSGGDWRIGIGDDSTATLNVQNGATAIAGANVFTSPGFGASTININGGTWTIDGQLHIGGSGGVAGGDSTVTITNGGVASSAGAAFVYSSGTLNVGAGVTPATFSSNGNLTINGHVNYNSGTLISGGTLAVGGTVFLSSAGPGRANKKTLEVGGATLTSSGVIDLNDNDMLAHRDQKAYITQRVRDARNGGQWDMPGITSTAAKSNPQYNTTLGVLSGAEYSLVNAGTMTFNSRAFAATDSLVKYTYYGDTDFNGRVNFDDYVRIDNGFNSHLSGWLNGDFDGNGIVNFDDYVLIDLAFNTQSGTLKRALSFLDGSNRSTDDMSDTALRRIEQHFFEFGCDYAIHFLSAVPEPAAAIFLGAMLPLLRRSRRLCRGISPLVQGEPRRRALRF
jgi:T5SS/PEP-CTERM-associated repeat protein